MKNRCVRYSVSGFSSERFGLMLSRISIIKNDERWMIGFLYY